MTADLYKGRLGQLFLERELEVQAGMEPFHIFIALYGCWNLSSENIVTLLLIALYGCWDLFWDLFSEQNHTLPGRETEPTFKVIIGN